MSMDKINGSPLMRPNLLDRFKVGNKDKEGEETSPLSTSAESPITKTSDRAEISDTAHQLMDLRAAVDVGREALEAIPDVRADRVAQARQRLEKGFYNSQVVQDTVAGNLAKVLGKIDDL